MNPTKSRRRRSNTPTKSKRNNTSSTTTNPMKSRELESTIKKPKDPERNIIWSLRHWRPTRRSREKHQQTRHRHLEPSPLPLRAFTVVAWVWSLVCFFGLRSLSLFFVGRRMPKIEPYKLDLYSRKSSPSHSRC